jgi:hypothetical protein
MKSQVAICLLLAANVLFARGVTTHERLTRAQERLKAKEYSLAVTATKELLDQLALETVEDIVLAHKILGVSYCELQEQAKATEHFEALLSFSPKEEIGDLAPSVRCASLYTQLKNPKGKIVAANPVVIPAPENSPVITKKATTAPSSWKLYVPFGTGQFYNRQNTKGWAFLSTETISFGVGFAGLLLFNGSKNTNGTFSDPDAASAYRAMYWGGLSVGIGATVWGIIDAIVVNRRAENRTEKAAFNLHFSPAGMTGKF